MSKRARPPSPRIVAMTLATETAQALGVDPQARDELVGTAFCVGQWLADQRRPGEWEAVDTGALLRAMAFTDPFETSTFLFALAALFGQGALQGDLRLPAARRVLRQIAGLCPDQEVAGFAGRTVEILTEREAWLRALPDAPPGEPP